MSRETGGAEGVWPLADGRQWAILPGDVRAGLASLPAGSVHCVVTSPPYWGLRSYSTAPQIWGGTDPDCDHGETVPAPGPTLTGGTGTANGKQVTNAGSQWGNAWEDLGTRTKGGSNSHGAILAGRNLDGWRSAQVLHGGATCTRCGAWRGELGSEPLPDCLAWARGEPPCALCFVCHIRTIFAAVHRTLRDDGNLLLNLGDSYSGSGKGPTGHNGIGAQSTRQGFTGGTPHHASYAGRAPAPGLKPKDLIGVPWRCALALQADGWYLRSDIIWAKPNPMPESVRDRCTRAHEYVFHLTKSARYYWDADAISEPVAAATVERLAQQVATQAGSLRANGGAKANGPMRAVGTIRGRNCRSVWSIPTYAFSAAHFATYPPALVERCVKAACPPEGVVLDPFCGSGTTLLVANRLGRRAIGCELNASYCQMAEKRLREDAPLVAAIADAAPAARQAGLFGEG